MKLSVTLAVVALLLVAAPAAAASANDLANLDFHQLLGSPLMAVVQAQGLSARTTMRFIEDVGFQPATQGSTTRKAVLLDFSYTTKGADGTDHQGKISVPLLTMLPLPYLVFESVYIEINIKIASSYETSYSSSSERFSENSSSGGGSWWGGSGSWSSKTSTTSKSSYNSKHKVERAFQLKVALQASQKEMPEGTHKVLDKLLEQITATTTL